MSTSEKDKEFSTLRANLALNGYSLHRSAHADGPQVYFVSHRGNVRQFQDIESVARSVEKKEDGHA
jgi:hypothetical protein